MKTNFKTKKTNLNSNNMPTEKKEDLTQEEFEELMRTSGAAGSFMIFRSTKKSNELGIDQI